MFQVLGTIYAQLGLDDQSLALMAKHVAQTRLAYGEGSPQLLKSLLRLAIAERNVDIDRPGQRAALAEAGAIIDRASGIELDAKSVFWVLAAEYYGDNDFTKALTLVRQASAAAHEVWFDAEEGERPTALVGIARLQLAAGDCRQASANAGEAAEYLRRQQAQPACEGACYVQMGLALELGGLAAACLGQADAAGAALREALAASRKTFGDDDLATLRIEARLAAWLWTAGQHAEARTMLEGIARALEGHTAQDRSKQHFNVLAAAATAMNVLKNHGHALRLADRALALRDPAIDASPFVAAVLRDKARALAGLQRYGEAAEVLARAKAMREKAGIRPAAALQEEAAITALLPV
jgi:tetratricopeptide (TPR) repeat protein